MAQKIVDIPGIGEVLLAKRRGSRSLRLTIQPGGRVRVGMPYWAPYPMAIKFALSRSDWINQHARQHRPAVLRNGARIGKSYQLTFVPRKPGRKTVSARVGANTVTVASLLSVSDPAVQKSAAKASERALKRDAEELLGPRLAALSRRHGFEYRELRIKRLTSRWGSCSAGGVITLNYFLIQLPWRLIDYVILHELVHTRHRHHGPEFWMKLEEILPGAKILRNEIRKHQPVLNPGP